MTIKDTHEYKRIYDIIESIHYAPNAALTHAYHKGFLMAVLAQAARNDNRVIHILEAAKAALVKKGWRDRAPDS